MHRQRTKFNFFSDGLLNRWLETAGYSESEAWPKSDYIFSSILATDYFLDKLWVN